MIYDRTARTWYKEKQFGGALLKLLYSKAFKPLRPLFLRSGFSDLASEILERSYDRTKIDKLMATHGIDPNLFEGYPYENFRDFFERRYKKDAFVDALPTDVLSPSDGRVVTYPITEGLKVLVKGVSYSIKDLLGESEAANLFRGGQLFIIRLALADCHRFNYTESGPLNGKPVRRIPGLLHTVSAYSEREPVLRENERRFSLIESSHGLVAVMEIGALLVGRIHYHQTKSAVRSAERGWFELGGSTIVLLYQKDMIIADPDIIRETSAGNEVKVRLGERIGQYVKTT